MGKTVNAQTGRIHPMKVPVADGVVQWVRMVVASMTRVALRRLPGQIVWSGGPGNTAATFWSGAQGWLHFRPQ